jgi:RNA recognition motif-containing protein
MVKVFVGNLAFKTTEADLAREFAAAGKVAGANIITRGPRSLGYGFVEMDSEDDAQNAVKLMSKKEINGREINVEIAKPQDETKEKQPRQKTEGEVDRLRKPKRKPAKKDGEGSQPSQKREVEESDEKDDGERPRRQRTRRGAPGQKRVATEESREESKTTLFVANLPFSLDDEGFAKIITDLSLKLKSAHVVKKRNGRSKGYGFVEFDTQDDQQKALTALNKKVIENRELSVKVALTEIRREEEQDEKKAAPTEKKAAVPAEKKASAPAEKKAVAPAEKKAVAPAEKKAVAPVTAEKKTASPAPAEKKTASPAPTEKKEEKKAAPAEKKAAAPAEKKTGSPAPAEKKAAAPAEKKAATPEKKDEKK